MVKVSFFLYVENSVPIVQGHMLDTIFFSCRWDVFRNWSSLPHLDLCIPLLIITNEHICCHGQA